MKNSMFLIGVLMGASLGSPQLASGQVPQASPADCTQDPGCETLKNQAAERSKNGDTAEALRLYKLAYEVRPDPRLLFNIARVLHKLGQTTEAVPYYQKFLDASPVQDAEQPERERRAREYLGQLQAAQQPAATDPSALAAVATQPKRPLSSKPFYKKWWFWTIVGTSAAAGIAGGIAGGVLASQRLPEPVLRPFEP